MNLESDYKWLINRLKEKFGYKSVMLCERNFGTELAIGVQSSDGSRRHAVCVETWICSDPINCNRHNPEYDDNGYPIHHAFSSTVCHTKYSLNLDPNKEDKVSDIEKKLEEALGVST